MEEEERDPDRLGQRHGTAVVARRGVGPVDAPGDAVNVVHPPCFAGALLPDQASVTVVAAGGGRSPAGKLRATGALGRAHEGSDANAAVAAVVWSAALAWR
jgi:hypothetical protein